MDDNHLKQRIVGAVVLVALAVIFIPMLLSGDRENAIPLFGTNIPGKPDEVARVKTLEIKPIQQPPKPRTVVREPIDEHSPKPVQEKKTPEPTKTKPIETSKTVAKTTRAWVVQVGSFTKQSNALGLRDKLRKQGYKAFVEKISSKERQVYRVRIGPEIRKENAQKLQQQLKRKLKLDGLVIAHP